MNKLLLPYPFKIVGYALTSIGIIFGVFYTWFDFRFTIPVFAVYSSFLETKIFATFKTNFADELILMLCIIGLTLVIFSKEKNETENLDLLRSKALAKAFLFNNIFLIFSILFIYGYGFISMLIINMFSFSVFYLLFFFFMKRKI